MSGGSGGRFNIWIAYSDLFTNLSTFLFISAIGIFAIMGAGSLTARERMGAMQCAFSGTLPGKVEAPDSLLKHRNLPPRLVGRSRDCGEYYAVDKFRFRPGRPDLASLRSVAGISARRDDLQQICLPIWRMAVNRNFNALNGRISIISVSDPHLTSAGATCGDPLPETRGMEGFPEKISAESTIRRCKANPRAYDSASVNCREILDCLTKHDDRSEWCQLVAGVDIRDRLFTVNCYTPSAEAQARALYNYCESAALKRQFHTEIFDNGQEAMAEARHIDGRWTLWRRNVTYAGAVSESAFDGEATNPLLINSPNGALFVEMRYER